MRIQEHWQDMESELEALLLAFFTLLGAAETPEDWPCADNLPITSSDQDDRGGTPPTPH